MAFILDAQFRVPKFVPQFALAVRFVGGHGAGRKKRKKRRKKTLKLLEKLLIQGEGLFKGKGSINLGRNNAQLYL